MQKRELWKVIFFGLITLGIYDLVWLYKTRNEMVAKGQKIPSFWVLFAPLLLIIGVMVLQFIARFVLSGASDASVTGETNSLAQLINIISFLAGIIALLGFIPVSLYWTYMYCKAVEAVTQGQTSVGFAFGLWFLLNFFAVGFIWPGLIQDGFNKST